MDKILLEYQRVHEKVHGKKPHLTQNGRWVYIDGDYINSYCKSEIPQMTENLKKKLH